MSQKWYIGLLIAVLLIGIASTVFLILYTVDAYTYSSIIHYIANERW